MAWAFDSQRAVLETNGNKDIVLLQIIDYTAATACTVTVYRYIFFISVVDQRPRSRTPPRSFGQISAITSITPLSVIAIDKDNAKSRLLIKKKKKKGLLHAANAVKLCLVHAHDFMQYLFCFLFSILNHLFY